MVMLIGVPQGIVTDRGINTSKTVTKFNHLADKLISDIVDGAGPTFSALKQQIMQLNEVERDILLNELSENTARLIAIVGISEQVMRTPGAQAKESVVSLFINPS